MAYLLVAIGGALGSVLRYVCSGMALRLFGAGFPYGTLFVNVVGSYIIGMAGAFVIAEGRAFTTLDFRLFVVTGILGGFTTFSAFSLDTLTLARGGNLSGAAVNVVLSLALCLTAVWLGHFTATAFAR
ncbi:MAG: fluoride efflux transporter CrcB [Gammaproteobacteria bacterium]